MKQAEQICYQKIFEKLPNTEENKTSKSLCALVMRLNINIHPNILPSIAVKSYPHRFNKVSCSISLLKEIWILKLTKNVY